MRTVFFFMTIFSDCCKLHSNDALNSCIYAAINLQQKGVLAEWNQSKVLLQSLKKDYKSAGCNFSLMITKGY